MDFNPAENIVLENKRVRLAPLSIDHHEALLLVATGNPDLLRYSPSQIERSDLLKVYISKAIVNLNNRYPFVIFDKTKGEFAGSTSFGNISNYDKRLEIGWTWIGRSFQRTGLNRNCKFLLLEYAFEVLNFERVELKTDARNQQSRKAIEGIGATYEGNLRSHTLMPDGYRRDTVYYSILKREWGSVKTSIFKSL